ncbi:hypothetical protein Bpfe_004913 [Biomphalaria pfeifferi]|uniref:Uncharacterized protein n=1 Tax=Biomphalaria pfeifferi TaxID=112525 RepID=A0AAD8FIE5_BIOPF|nr:hypothetical protein Bpfe_004913 [Biomphalaria pfeifferi]
MFSLQSGGRFWTLTRPSVESPTWRIKSYCHFDTPNASEETNSQVTDRTHKKNKLFDVASIFQFDVASIFQSDVASIFQFDVASIFQFDVASIFQFDVASIFQSDVASIFQSDVASIFQSDVASIFQSDVASIFQSDVASIFQSDVASIFQFDVASIFQFDVASILNSFSYFIGGIRKRRLFNFRELIVLMIPQGLTMDFWIDVLQVETVAMVIYV